MAISPFGAEIKFRKFPVTVTYDHVVPHIYSAAYEAQNNPVQIGLKHKDSLGKSQNLSKIFFAEILVFDHDYEGKSSSNNGLL